MMPSELSDLHFDGYIYGCGTHIYMDNKLLFFRTVPNLLCKETVNLLRKCKIEALFESNTEILYDGASPAQSEFGARMRKEIPMVDITKFNREDACTYSYDKFLVHMLPDSNVEKFRSFCNDHYTYFEHGDGIWEVTQKGTSKATGMKFLLDRLSIPKENSYAFGDSPNDLPMLKEAGISVDIEENGTTFEENALIKANAVAAYTDAIVLADDSGLEIDYLNKEPGVYSARYMGEDTSYTIKNQNLLERLNGVPKEQRTARFVCAIAAVLPDKETLVTRETIEGYIGFEPQGENGFGYDPIFYVDEYNCSTASLPPDKKNEMSHRGKALRAMKEALMGKGLS